MKAAVTSGAWITTGGLNAGVMKLVGEVIHDHESNINTGQKVVVLGISPWNMIPNNEKLANNESCEYVIVTIKEYQVEYLNLKSALS